MDQVVETIVFVVEASGVDALTCNGHLNMGNSESMGRFVVRKEHLGMLVAISGDYWLERRLIRRTID